MATIASPTISSPLSPASPTLSHAGTITSLTTQATTATATTINQQGGQGGQGGQAGQGAMGVATVLGLNNPGLQGGQKNGPSMTEEEINALLHRLSSKQTVQSLMILNRSDGAIIRRAGQLSAPSATSSGTNTETSIAGDKRGSLYGAPGGGGVTGAEDGILTEESNERQQVIEEGAAYAALVWKFVKTAEDMVRDEAWGVGVGGIGVGGVGGGAGEEDSLKLLRIRTKRHELVIVPDARYILVVVHDTPTAT